MSTTPKWVTEPSKKRKKEARKKRVGPMNDAQLKRLMGKIPTKFAIEHPRGNW